MEMSNKLPGKPLALLDDLLEYFEYDRRDLDETHDAIADAGFAADVYMKLMTAPPAPISKLRFWKS